MIHAREALELPSAKLSQSDAAVVIELLKDIECFIRNYMTRNGVTIQIDPRRINSTIAAEIGRECRHRGWIAEFQQKVGLSRLTNEQVITDFQLLLIPGDNIYEQTNALQFHQTNGVNPS